jgi:hypothetical protein
LTRQSLVHRFIERAYHLVDTGEFRSVEEIIDQLIAERYEGESVYLNFEARAATRSDLRERCRVAQSGLSVASSASLSESRARRFERKAVECLDMADGAQSAESCELFLRLAATYLCLASDAAEAAGEAPDESDPEAS